MAAKVSSSMERRVVGYLKPKYHSLLKSDVANTQVSESQIINEAVKQYYDNKNKSSTLSKNSY